MKNLPLVKSSTFEQASRSANAASANATSPESNQKAADLHRVASSLASPGDKAHSRGMGTPADAKTWHDNHAKAHQDVANFAKLSPKDRRAHLKAFAEKERANALPHQKFAMTGNLDKRDPSAPAATPKPLKVGPTPKPPAAAKPPAPVTSTKVRSVSVVRMAKSAGQPTRFDGQGLTPVSHHEYEPQRASKRAEWFSDKASKDNKPRSHYDAAAAHVYAGHSHSAAMVRSGDPVRAQEFEASSKAHYDKAKEHETAAAKSTEAPIAKSELLSAARLHYARLQRSQRLGKAESAGRHAELVAKYVTRLGHDHRLGVPAEVQDVSGVDLTKTSHPLDRVVLGGVVGLPLVKGVDCAGGAGNTVPKELIKMDPDAAHKRFRLAVAEGDHEEAQEAHGDLKGWLGRGGFKPKWSASEAKSFHSYKPPKMAKDEMISGVGEGAEMEMAERTRRAKTVRKSEDHMQNRFTLPLVKMETSPAGQELGKAGKIESSKFRITTPSGEVHEGEIQGNGGVIRGKHGHRGLTMLSQGKRAKGLGGNDYYEPKPGHVAMYHADEASRPHTDRHYPVQIRGSKVEMV